MLDSVVTLFTKDGSNDSEEYVNPKIERIDVTTEGKSNLVYERGILGMDLFHEANRLFGSKEEMDSITEDNVLDDKFAAVSRGSMGRGCKRTKTRRITIWNCVAYSEEGQVG
mgnify:CR=1 FL=1